MIPILVFLLQIIIPVAIYVFTEIASVFLPCVFEKVIDQGSANPGLEGRCFADFRCDYVSPSLSQILSSLAT